MSRPIADATIDKSLRWLDVVAELRVRRAPASAEELRRCVPAYQVSSDTAFRRMFARDRSDLRSFGIPIDTVSGRDGGESRYRLRSSCLELPPGALASAIDESDLASIRDAAMRLSRNDAGPHAPGAARALRWLRFDLPLAAPTIPSDDGQPSDAADVFEMLAAAVVYGKRLGGARGLPVSIRDLAAELGAPADLLRRIAERASERPLGYRTEGRAMRILSTEPYDTIAFVIGTMTRPWRPRRQDIDSLIALVGARAETNGFAGRLVRLARDGHDPLRPDQSSPLAAEAADRPRSRHPG